MPQLEDRQGKYCSVGCMVGKRGGEVVGRGERGGVRQGCWDFQGCYSVGGGQRHGVGTGQEPTAAWRHRAALSPPMPAPAMMIFG